jgi:hypothetical protein
LAVGPLLALLILLVRDKYWSINRWQILLLVLPATAFLAVGLVASVKVGGGLDLHNMDMLLVTLVLIAGIAWDSGVGNKIANLMDQKRYRELLLLSVVIPAFLPMLTVTPPQLAPREKINSTLTGVREYVQCAQQYGEVLFMDERQLITFGYIDVPLVPEFEKRAVMDNAMSDNGDYFANFYQDLQDGRFSLIVADPQLVIEKEVGESLAEENNAWVRWVTEPLLNEYESVNKYREVAIELFMPIDRDYQCP